MWPNVSPYESFFFKSAMKFLSPWPARILNINKFIELSRLKGEIATAVFTAVSIKTVSYLKALIDVVTNLGVHVLMLTDLNFKENLNDTLWKNADATIQASLREAVAYAFSKKRPV